MLLIMRKGKLLACARGDYLLGLCSQLSIPTNKSKKGQDAESLHLFKLAVTPAYTLGMSSLCSDFYSKIHGEPQPPPPKEQGQRPKLIRAHTSQPEPSIRLEAAQPVRSQRERSQLFPLLTVIPSPPPEPSGAHSLEMHSHAKLACPRRVVRASASPIVDVVATGSGVSPVTVSCKTSLESTQRRRVMTEFFEA